MAETLRPNPKPQGEPSAKMVRALIYGALLLVGLPGLTAGGWVGANVALRTPEPPLLWTEDDLPALPAERDNGWATFQREAARLSEPATPAELTRLADGDSYGDPRATWREAERRAPAIAATVGAGQNRRWLELLSLAYAHPRFADACPIDPGISCRQLSLHNAHKLAELALLHQGLAGRFAEAFAAAERLLQVDFAFARSTRSPLSRTVAVAALRRTLQVTAVLLAGYEEQRPAERDDPGAALPRLGATIAAIRPEELGQKRSVIGAYIFQIRALAAMEQRPLPSLPEGYNQAARLLYDRGGTISALNAYYTQVLAFAAAPLSRPAPQPPRYREGTGWWLHNAAGKVSLHLSLDSLPAMLRTGAAEVAALARQRAELHRTIASAGGRTAQRGPR